MEVNILKRKLRDLKKIEKSIRCYLKSDVDLIWNKYFSTKSENNNVKYNLSILASVDHITRKEIFEEYFYEIYYIYMNENNFCYQSLYNPELLDLFDLSPYSTIDEIKKRFKELAKKYHPDLGGDNDKMIQLLEIYNKLTKNS